MGLKRVIQDAAQSIQKTGFFQAGLNAIRGNLGDQWLEAIEPAGMDEGVVFCGGQRVHPDDQRAGNHNGTPDVISNGSYIHVYDNQAMLLVENGAIIDFSAEPGRFEVDNSSTPSIFRGQLRDSVLDTFERFKFGGGTPNKQQAFYVNLQEIKGVKFGTPQSIQYYDAFYNAELFLRCHGTFSLKIVDPILFYREAIPRSANHVHIDEIKEQYLAEFLTALQTAIGQLSAQGVRIAQLTMNTTVLTEYMRNVLDADWLQMRGMEIQAVGIQTITYDENSRNLINKRAELDMVSDPNLRETYVQTAIARGIEAAGSNEAGAGQTFFGMGLGMQASGNFMQSASQSNQAQMSAQQAAAPGVPGMGVPVGAEAPAQPWACPQCQTANTGNFCSQCGQGRPAAPAASFCSNCGTRFEGERPRFCTNCGHAQA